MHCTCTVLALYNCTVLALYLHRTCTVLALYNCTVLALYLHCTIALYNCTVQLHCTCTVLALYLHCTCTVLALYLHCTCTVLALYLHCTCTVQLHCTIALYLHCTCTILALYNCTVLALYLHCTCTVLASFRALIVSNVALFKFSMSSETLCNSTIAMYSEFCAGCARYCLNDYESVSCSALFSLPFKFNSSNVFWRVCDAAALICLYLRGVFIPVNLLIICTQHCFRKRSLYS